MFESDNEKDFFAEAGAFDLGSEFGSFEDPFADVSAADDAKPMAAELVENADSKIKEQENAAAEKPEKQEEEIKMAEGSENEAENHVSEDAHAEENQADANIQTGGAAVPNPFDAAIAQAEEKQAESAKSSLKDKLPVFSYAKATEEIVDTSKTFEQLREEKAEDFPELDDGSAVSWKMVYGTVTKQVANPKKTTIAALKKQIEDSKEFTASLKKAKGEITCKVTPSVTAKKKGTAFSPYKGVFPSVDEAVQSGKVIAFVPAHDGSIYEVRNNKIGTFVARTYKVNILPKVRAGFTPALPKIPGELLLQILSFFKTYAEKGNGLEVMAYIYWSEADGKYYAYIPKQTVAKDSIKTALPEMDEERFTLVMEIHSHNTMEAFFSPTDDKDERATRLYAVVGRFDKVFPDIKVRMSAGGNFMEIAPEDVFECFNSTYPDKWNDAVITETEASL